MSDNNSWCVLPWIHICVRTDMTLKPCCRFQSPNPTREFTAKLTDFSTNAQIMDNEYFTNLRSKMIKGEQISGCQKCYSSEKINGSSLRTKLNNRFKNVTLNTATSNFHNIEYIEMSLDNICNLECRMCNSMFSTKLLNRDKHLKRKQYKKLEPSFTYFDNADLTNLTYVKILGGEPFISPNFLEFLLYLENKSDVSKIELEISTNGTTTPSAKVVEKLLKYAKINLNVSLDAYHKSNDYQRQGSAFEKTYQNALNYMQILNNLHLSFHITVSSLTANTLASTINFLTENNHAYSLDLVRDPKHLSLYCAPNDFLLWLAAENSENKSVVDLFKKTASEALYNEAEWSKFLNEIKTLDKYYRINLVDYNPKLHEFLKEKYASYSI